MRRTSYYVLLILIILISGCSGGNPDRNLTMNYDFAEPFRFPFEVNEVRTEVEMDDPYALQQYVFHYKNKQTTQEIKLILSKVFDDPENISEVGKSPFTLKMVSKPITRRMRIVNPFGGKVKMVSWPALFIISTGILIR